MQENNSKLDHSLATPASSRRLLSKLPTLRRKRPSRSFDGGKLSTLPSVKHMASACSHHKSQHQGGSLAIQHHDQDHDAVVITTLPVFPFCCHEDLVNMSRRQLLDVAAMFNSRLPSRTKIADLEIASDAHIRNCIEKLVGIPRAPPWIPRCSPPESSDQDIETIMDSFEDCQLDRTPTPPSSPLTLHVSRRKALKRHMPFSNPPQSLDVLIEEDESDFSSYRRLSKKQKVEEGCSK